MGPFDELPPKLRERFAESEAETLKRLEPGDELWEWDMGGWNTLAGRAGLAILRDGVIVRSWLTWKS